MQRHLADVPTVAVTFDELRFPDRDTEFILEHLIRYCSKFTPLPVVTVLVEGPRATVVRGHKYVLAARALNRPSLRVHVDSRSSPESVAAFLDRDDVTVLEWETGWNEEANHAARVGGHVFYFERALSDDEKHKFDVAVMALFQDPGIEVHHDDAGPLAEFEAVTPSDHKWAREHLRTFAAFSERVAKIVSFQGSRFHF